MEKNKDGPQAATRHVKDRRPAYHTNAARSIATMERRLSALESRQPPSQSSPSAAKAAVASDLDADLNRFGMMYNDLEERISALESQHGRPHEINERLSAIEERLKPYEDYRTQALNAVEQLKVFHQQLINAKPTKQDDMVSRLVDEHKASLSEYSGRLKILEDKSELTQVQAMSTRDLARALAMRLEHGDSLDLEITHNLRSCLEWTANDGVGQRSAAIARLPETPATDEAAGACQATVETSIESADGSSKKRKQTANPIVPPRLSKTVRRDESEPERYSTPDVSNALNAFKDGDFSTLEDRKKHPSSDFHVPPERRSSRKLQPSRRHEEMVSWKEAESRLRGAG